MVASHRSVGAMLVMIGALVLAAPAHAQDKAALSAAPSSVTLEKGAGSLVLSNETALELTITLAVVDENGKPVRDATGSLATGSRLGPGAAATVKVTVPKAPPASTLVARAAPTSGLPQGAVLRVPLAKLAPAKPAVTEWTIVRKHAAADTGERLPLTKPCGGLNLTKPEELGTVQAGGRSLTITGSCPEKDAKWLKLAATHRGSDGRDYKGKIKVGETEVDLTVEDTLAAGVAALLIFFGFLPALLVSLWPGGGRPTAELLRQSHEVEDLVDPDNRQNSDRSFSKAARALGLPKSVQEWRIGPAVREKIAEIRESLDGFPDADELKEAKEQLESLEADVEKWPKLANSLGKLHKRLGTLRPLEKYVRRVRSRTLDREGRLDLDAMSEIRATATEALALIEEWPSETIEAARARAAALGKDHPASKAFAAVSEELSAARTADAAREALDSFWDVNKELHQASIVRDLLGTSAMKELVDAPKAGTAGWVGFFRPVEADDPAATARDIGRKIAVIDLFVLVVLLGAALVAGMQALWVGKSFGGFWDVVAALVWGLGTGAISTALTTAVTNFGRSSLISAASPRRRLRP